MAKRGWQVGAVLKDKPGSQGTLFRGGSDQMSDRRFPRGYTPERLAEVKGAMVRSESVTRDDTPEDTRIKDQAHRSTIDVVARSTVPTEHLSNLQFGYSKPHEHLTQGDGAAGLYMRPTPHREHGLIFTKPKYSATSTTIHEIGHHVSHTIENTEHSKNYSYESEHGGREEAFADNYASTHYRDRKGRVEEQDTYGGGRYLGHIQRSDSFWDGYGKARERPVLRAEIEADNEKYYKKNPDERANPDGSVDEPLVHHYGDGVTGINHDALHWPTR